MDTIFSQDRKTDVNIFIAKPVSTEKRSLVHMSLTLIAKYPINWQAPRKSNYSLGVSIIQYNTDGSLPCEKLMYQWKKGHVHKRP